MTDKNLKIALARLVRLARLCHQDSRKAKSTWSYGYELGNRNGYMHAAWIVKGLHLGTTLEKAKTRNHKKKMNN